MGERNITKIIYYGLGKSNTYDSILKYLKKKHGQITFDESCPTHLICKDKSEFKLIESKDLDDIKELLSRDVADEAFIPFANSISGIVPHVKDFLIEKRDEYEVIGSFSNAIVLYPYVNKENSKMSKYEIETIYSNLPVACQCSSYINSHAPFAVFKKVGSTTEALQWIGEHKEEKAIAFGNIDGKEIDNVVLYENQISSDGGGSYTRFFHIKAKGFVKEKKINLKKITIESLLQKIEGKYIYSSIPSPHSSNSHAAAAFRLVDVKLNNNEIFIQGYTVEANTKKFFHSDSSTTTIQNGKLRLFYEYTPEITKSDVQTVKGLVFIKTDVESFLRTGILTGNYYGWDNNKCGNVTFYPISKKEFEVYLND